MSVHPALLLAAWIALACVLPWLGPDRLFACSLLLLPMTFLHEARTGFARLLRRTRILLIMLVVMYGFFSPGAPLFPSWPAGPSAEGFLHGGLQAWRLLLMLLSLSALLAFLGRKRLLAGLYVLLLPFKLLGMPVERVVVRLALSMQAAQAQAALRLTPSAMALAMNQPPSVETQVVEIELPLLRWQDGLFALLFALVLGGLLR